MKNRIFKTILSLMLTFTIATNFMQNSSAATRTYQVTYSAGLNGQFKKSLVQEYQEIYGTKKVTQSKATGNITITVEAKKAMPNAPTASDITLKNADQYYVLTSGWQPATTKVVENATYVVQYGALISGVEYSIRYVDATTLQDVATPVIASANVDEVMNVYAKNVNGYTFDNQTKTMTLSKDKTQNTLTFYYTAYEKIKVVDRIEENTVTRDREVIENVNNDNNTVIPDNTPPLAGGNVNDNVTDDNNTNDNTTIPDNDVPLAKGDELSQNNQVLYYGIGATVVVILIGIVGYTIYKKRKA